MDTILRTGSSIEDWSTNLILGSDSSVQFGPYYIVIRLNLKTTWNVILSNDWPSRPRLVWSEFAYLNSQKFGRLKQISNWNLVENRSFFPVPCIDKGKKSTRFWERWKVGWNYTWASKSTENRYWIRVLAPPKSNYLSYNCKLPILAWHNKRALSRASF